MHRYVFLVLVLVFRTSSGYESSCCFAHDKPGTWPGVCGGGGDSSGSDGGDISCQRYICDHDNWCCHQTWDAFCANEARGVPMSNDSLGQHPRHREWGNYAPCDVCNTALTPPMPSLPPIPPLPILPYDNFNVTQGHLIQATMCLVLADPSVASDIIADPSASFLPGLARALRVWEPRLTRPKLVDSCPCGDQKTECFNGCVQSCNASGCPSIERQDSQTLFFGHALVVEIFDFTWQPLWPGNDAYDICEFDILGNSTLTTKTCDACQGVPTELVNRISEHTGVSFTNMAFNLVERDPTMIFSDYLIFTLALIIIPVNIVAVLTAPYLYATAGGAEESITARIKKAVDSRMPRLARMGSDLSSVGSDRWSTGSSFKDLLQAGAHKTHRMVKQFFHPHSVQQDKPTSHASREERELAEIQIVLKIVALLSVLDFPWLPFSWAVAWLHSAFQHAAHYHHDGGQQCDMQSANVHALIELVRSRLKKLAFAGILMALWQGVPLNAGSDHGWYPPDSPGQPAILYMLIGLATECHPVHIQNRAGVSEDGTPNAVTLYIDPKHRETCRALLLSLNWISYFQAYVSTLIFLCALSMLRMDSKPMTSPTPSRL